MVGWARLAGGGGTRAGMSRLPIRKWIRQWKLAWAAKASRGIENSTTRDWYLFRTASRETTRNISPSGVPAVYSARTQYKTRSTSSRIFTATTPDAARNKYQTLS